MTAVSFRNTEVRLSEALDSTCRALDGHEITLRDLLGLVGEQGLLVFCAVLAMPFLLPVTLPFSSTVFGLPMLLIGVAVTLNRVPWLPARLLNRALPGATVRNVLCRAARVAGRFEHLVRPRMLALTESAVVNAINGVVMVVAAIALMMPLPLIPLANTLPAVAIILLCIGIAERDGLLVLVGHVVVLIAMVYVGGVLWLAAQAGSDPQAALESVLDIVGNVFGR